MKHKNSHLLVGYWGRIRKGRQVPDQTDIDPRAIKRMLTNIFILDATSIARPTYRLAGTGLCERFGIELRGTNYLGQWEPQSGVALASLLKQSLKLRQPVCLASVGATGESGMVELETMLAPISFGGTEPTRFVGMVQVLSETSAYRRAVLHQRLVGSQFVREDEPLAMYDDLPPPPPPPGPTLRIHPKAPHLRLVASRDKPATLHFETEALMNKLLAALERGLSLDSLPGI